MGVTRFIHPILCLVLAVFWVQPAGADSTVAQFRHGPDHAGAFAAPGPGILQKQRWIYRTGNRMIASPVVADGTVFVGAMDGQMHAIDLGTGKARWRFGADAPISATAAVAGGMVYFQSDANTVYAVRAADGALVWRAGTGPSLAYHNDPKDPDGSDWDYYASSPLYVDGRIVIGSGDGHIYAFDAQSGARIWAVKTGSRVRATPAGDGATVYVGGFDGVMYALNAQTGVRRWTFKTAGNVDFPVGEIQSSAALAGGLVLFGSRDYNFYALDAASGRLVWKDAHAGSWVVGSPAVAGDAVCVGSSDAAFVRCNALQTGKVLWTAKVGGNVFSSPVVAGGALYVGVLDGQLVRLSLRAGEMDGYRLDERIYASPWIEGDRLVIAVNDGTVRVFGVGKP